MEGFTEGIVVQGLSNADGHPIRIPGDATVMQAALIIEKFMREHPEMMHQDAAISSELALAAAFPCPKSN